MRRKFRALQLATPGHALHRYGDLGRTRASLDRHGPEATNALRFTAPRSTRPCVDRYAGCNQLPGSGSGSRTMTGSYPSARTKRTKSAERNVVDAALCSG